MLRSLHAPGLHLRPAVCLLFALAVVVSALPSAAAQERANKTSPRSVLGFTPGDDRKVADWRQITDYFSRLDIASDRISVRTLGETTLGRPLIVAFVSAAENIRHLNRYQEIQRKLADPRAVSDKAESDALLRDGKVVVAISCSVNADEIVASQLSMQLAYALATARDAATLNILQNTILLLIPSGNPDGLDLVARWYRKTLGTPYEGTLPPELSHPYAGHDNSLDWLTLNLKETRLIARLLWQEWFPQLVYDLHEHSAAPARFTIPPLDGLAVSNILSSLNRESEALRLGLAADVEAAGFGDAATGPPCETGRHANLQAAAYYHNAVTLVSETMSAKLLTPSRWGSAARVVDGAAANGVAAANYRQEGTGGLWRPRDMLLLGERAVISVLSKASERRADYLRNFYELGRANVAATTYWPRAYLLPAGQSPDEALAHLVGVLLEQGVEVFRLDGELHVSDQVTTTTHRMRGRRGMKETPAGGYIIFLAQPYGSLVRALFDPRASADDCTTNNATRRKSEATGVSLPMRMGVEVEAVWMIRESRSEMRLVPVTRREEVYRDLGLPASGRRGLRTRPTTRPIRLGVYKSWTRSPDEGWTRFVLDSFGVPYQSLLDRDVRGPALRRQYDVIILPALRASEIVEGNASGSYPPEFTGGITEAGLANLYNFADGGGTLICFGASCQLLIDKFGLPLRNILKDTPTSNVASEPPILRIELETAHPLAVGIAPSLNVSFAGGSAYQLIGSERVRSVARYAGKNVLRSGQFADEDSLKGKTALAEISVGRGRIIAFGFNPQFRGQTWGTLPLIFNSIIYGVEWKGEKAAIYKDEQGTVHAVSPVCTHMGCLVHWNNAEKSWDCPCHGSRFNFDGKVIQGPANEDLAPMRLKADDE